MSPGPWNEEPDGYLPAERLLDAENTRVLAEALGLTARALQRWRTGRRMFSVEQACHAAKLAGLNPFHVWPELESNIGPVHASWRDRAACKDKPSTIFFPPRLAPPGRLPKGTAFDPYATAREICRGCSVRHACLWSEMRVEGTRSRHGMFGGLTPGERNNLARLFDWRPRAQVMP